MEEIQRMIKEDYLICKIYTEKMKIGSPNYDVMFMGSEISYYLRRYTELLGMRCFHSNSVEYNAVVMMDSSKFEIEYSVPSITKDDTLTFTGSFNVQIKNILWPT